MVPAVAELDRDTPVPRNTPIKHSVSFNEAADVETINFPDMAFYHMLLDASKAEETIVLKVQPIFKPKLRHPLIDVLDVDKELVVRLLYDE